VRKLWARIDDSLHSMDRRWLRRRLWLWRATDWKNFRRIDTMTGRAILIGGCGRSGTTVLNGLLSCHPQVQTVDIETSAFCPTAYTADVDLDAAFQLDRVYRRLVRIEIPASCTRWSEKTPKNVLFARRALDYLGPGARFIHIVRDGRDVVTSRHRRAPDRYWVSPERWIQDVEAGRSLEAHPRGVHGAIRRPGPRPGGGASQPVRLPRPAIRRTNARVPGDGSSPPQPGMDTAAASDLEVLGRPLARAGA